MGCRADKRINRNKVQRRLLKPPSEREVAFSQENDGRSLRNHAVCANLKVARAPSVSHTLDSSLPEGAFDTSTFFAAFICFLLIGIAFTEPRHYGGVFVLQ